MRILFCLLTIFQLPHRDVVLWAQSLLHLTALFHLPLNTFVSHQWKRRCLSQIPSVSMYTFTRFCSPRAVYLKLAMPSHIHRTFNVPCQHAYVGSTSITIEKREANRVAKLKQVYRQQLVKVELALRYWHFHCSYFLFSTIVVWTGQDVIQVRAMETCLINEWRPHLNFPFCLKYVHRQALGFKRPRVQTKGTLACAIGFRLFCKVRRRRIKGGSRQNAHTTQAQAWNHVLSLASNAKKSFEMEK